MRRFRRPAVTVSKRRVILFRLFLVFCTAFAVFSVLDNRLRPVITTMAQYQCRVVSVLAMNEAVMEELNEGHWWKWTKRRMARYLPSKSIP